MQNMCFYTFYSATIERKASLDSVGNKHLHLFLSLYLWPHGEFFMTNCVRKKIFKVGLHIKEDLQPVKTIQLQHNYSTQLDPRRQWEREIFLVGRTLSSAYI